MMDFIVGNRWAFLITAEVLFWLLLVVVIVLRYWFKLDRASLITLIILIVNDLWIIALGIIDYMETGKLSLFQFVVAAVVLYAVVFGKRDVRRLDAYIKRKVAGWRGEAVDAPAGKKEWNTQKEIKGLIKHAVIYAVVHVVVIVGLGIRDMQEQGVEAGLLTFSLENFETKYHNLDAASGIWTLLLTIDVVYTIYNSLFSPKKNESR